MHTERAKVPGPHQPETPAVLAADYALEKTLGQNRAITWLARDLRTDQPVVIKALQFQEMQDWKDQELFQREISLLKQLTNPGVPRYLAESADDACLYLIMEAMPGQSLSSWLNTGQRADEALVVKLADQVLEILSYLHSFSPPVIHRDIKPGNLIWDGGQVYLVDFGGVQELLQPEGGSTVTGTYGYMAPEQFAGKASVRSDLYSLGASLVHLLTGRPPGDFLNARLQLQLPSGLAISGRLRYWLEHMTAYAPSQRFSDAIQARQALADRVPQTVTNDETGTVLVAGEQPSVSGRQAPAQTAVNLNHSHLFLTLSFQEPVLTSVKSILGLFAAGFGYVILLSIIMSGFEVPPLVFFLCVLPGYLLLFGSPFFAWILIAHFKERWVLQTQLALYAEGFAQFRKQVYFDGNPRRFIAQSRLSLRQIQAVQREVYMFENKKPRYRLNLRLSDQSTSFGAQLSDAEQRWLQAEILHFLQRHLPAQQAEMIQLQSEV